MNVTRDIQRTRNTPEEYGITSQGQNRSTEWIKKNRVRYSHRVASISPTGDKRERARGRGERERKRKKRKKEKESEEALIKPAARRVIKTRARPRDPDGSSGAYRHAGDFPSYARLTSSLCRAGARFRRLSRRSLSFREWRSAVSRPISHIPITWRA